MPCTYGQNQISRTEAPISNDLHASTSHRSADLSIPWRTDSVDRNLPMSLKASGETIKLGVGLLADLLGMCNSQLALIERNNMVMITSATLVPASVTSLTDPHLQ